MQSKIEGLDLILKYKSHYDLAAAYGHQMETVRQPFSYITGLQEARRRQPELFINPIVIPIFSETRERSYGKSDLFEEAEFSHLKGQVVIAEIGNDDLNVKLASLKPGQVLLVRVGYVSRRVFDLFFNISTLPTITEGRNSMNLMNQIGKPYLTSVDYEGYQFGSFNFSSGMRLAEKGFKGFLNVLRKDKEKNKEKNLDALANFFIESRDPDSALRKLFRKQNKTGELSKDKLYNGLSEVRRYLPSPVVRDCVYFYQ